MKVDFVDNDLIVFLNASFFAKPDFSNKALLEDSFRNVFIKLKDIYDIEVSGSYDITVYVDDNCGIILRLKKDDLDYFDYYDGQVDMSITVSKHDGFLYKWCGDFFLLNLLKCDVYLFDGDFYVLPINCSFMDMGVILENSSIVFGSDVSMIRSCGKKVDLRCFK